MLLKISSRTSSIMAEKIKMTDLLRFFTFYVNNLILCILPKCVMHVTNDQFSDKFNNGWKKSKSLIYCAFSHFTSIIWPCLRNNMKRVSFILLKFVMHVTNKQFSDKFNNNWKKFKIDDFLWFFAFYVNNCCGRNNFKFNNGGGLLSSVLLL